MDIDNGFPLFKILMLRIIHQRTLSLGVSVYRCIGIGISVCIFPLLPTHFISLRQLYFHATLRLAWVFVLSASLSFFVGLLCAKSELATKRGDALDLSCALLALWQVYQIVTSSKVLGSPSVESRGTLFVLRLMQIQFKSKR